MEKCSNCDGTGEVLEVDYADRLGDYTKKIICPVCNGKGYTGTEKDK